MPSIRPHVFFQRRAHDGSACILIAWQQVPSICNEKGMTEEQLTIHVGIDVSKDKLAVAIASGGERDMVLRRNS